ncbi:MAG: MmgE/PrpD family protein [Chloroflexota bacterium]|nr:MmgE/PrpD family protein [Chloroflexota bacterium]
MDKLLFDLCNYVNELTYSDLSDEVIHQTKRLWIDTLACTARAYESPPAQIAVTLCANTLSETPSTVFWGQHNTTADLATFANSIMVRYLDFNDFYQGPAAKESGHPSDTFPAVLACAQQKRKTGKDLILGSVIAWEIYGRLADSVGLRDFGFDQSVAISMATACAAGKMLDLDTQQLAHALALTTASNLTLGEVRFGEVSMWKGCAAANGSRNGVFAALLASYGMTGPMSIFSGNRGFFNVVSGSFDIKRLGGVDEDFRIMQSSMKHFPVGSVAQTALECAISLRSQIEDVHQINMINLRTFEFGVNIMADGPEKWTPETRETADHSLPYCLAVAFVFGEINDDYFADHYLYDSFLGEMLSKISVVSDPECTALFPEKRLSKLEVVLNSGEIYSAELGYHKGHPNNPMTDAEITEKFVLQTNVHLNKTQSSGFVDRLWSLEHETDLAMLMSGLTAKTTSNVESN